MLVNPEQYQNAPASIDVTEFGIVMLARPEQWPNVLRPIDVTEFGIVMLVRPEQLKYLQTALFQLFTC